jgi:predicted RNase H-like nuclease (RuvC/YqgF family)
VLPKHVPPVPRIQNPSVAWVYAPDTIRPQLSMQALFNMGVECGNASAKTELHYRTGMADVQIANAQREIADASKRIETLHGDVDGLQSRIGELQSRFERLETERDAVRNELTANQITLNIVTSSRSWRITRPLRVITLWARELRNKFARPANE